jgi:hypothetical protein
MSSAMYSTSPACAGGLIALSASLLTHTRIADYPWFVTGVLIALGLAAALVLFGFILTWGIAPDILMGMLVVPAGVLLVMAAVIFAFGPFWLGTVLLLSFQVLITTFAISKKRSLNNSKESMVSG